MFEDRENREDHGGMLQLDSSSDADFLRQTGGDGLFAAEPELESAEPQEQVQLNGSREGDGEASDQFRGATGGIEVDVDDYLVSAAGENGIDGNL